MRPKKAERRIRYDRRKLDGEIDHLGGRPIEEILADDEAWARGVLARAQLPQDLRFYERDGDLWLEVPEGTRYRDLKKGVSYEKVFGARPLGTPEGYAGYVLFYAEALRRHREAGSMDPALHCLRKMTQFRMKGAFVAEIESDALAGDRQKYSRRMGGRAEKPRRRLKAAADSMRWRAACDRLHRGFPERTLADIYREVGSAFGKHPDTIRKRVRALGFPSSGRLIGEVRARS